jgi:hypothetical protein
VHYLAVEEDRRLGAPELAQPVERRDEHPVGERRAAEGDRRRSDARGKDRDQDACPDDQRAHRRQI